MVFPREQAIVAVIIGHYMDPVEAQQLEFPKSCLVKKFSCVIQTWYLG